MKQSTNYNFNLPDKADQYDLEHWNENTEKTDTLLKQVNDKLNTEITNRTNGDTEAKNLANAKGVLAVEKGGTGETTATDASNMFLNALITGQDTPKDGDFYISQWAGSSELPDTNTNKKAYVRRPVSALWKYIKDKISSVLGLTASNYNGTSAKATADGSGNNIANSYALKKGSSSNFQSNTHYFKSLGGWQDQDSVVIPILEITSSVDENRYSNGKIFSQRNNGLYGSPYFEWYCNKQYSKTASEKYFLSVKSIFAWEIVTFNYNSKKYLGIAFKLKPSQCHEAYFDGYAYPMKEPLFTIIRYNNINSGIINQEIYDSLTEITNYSYSGFAVSATKAYSNTVYDCTTASNTSGKTLTIPNFTLEKGVRITVRFTNGHSLSLHSPKLNVNNTGDKAILTENEKDLGTYGRIWDENIVLDLMYNGSNWIIIGNPIIRRVGTDGFLCVHINGYKQGSTTVTVNLTSETNNFLLGTISESSLGDDVIENRTNCNISLKQLTKVSGSGYLNFLYFVTRMNKDGSRTFVVNCQGSQVTQAKFIINYAGY